MNDIQKNNRESTRRRALKAGLVSYHNDEMSVPCTVRDESESGARLQFDRHVNLPASFHLTVPLDGKKWPAAVQWTKGLVCGVRFTGPAVPSDIHRNQYIEHYQPDENAGQEPGARPSATPAPETERQPTPSTIRRKPFGRRK